MRMDLPEDPAVFKLASLLKMDRLSVVGRLYAFWSWADKHAVDGRVDGAASHVVDAVVQQDGFAAALEAVNWLVIADGNLTLPRHERHNGESAKERSLKNQRQARWRDKKLVDAKPSTSSSTEPSTREEKRRVTPIVPEIFLQFWTAYPRKESKARALEAFKKISFVNGDFEKLLAALEAAKGSDQWRRDGGKFIPHPATWLNDRRFEDEVVQPAKAVWTP